MDDDEMDIDEVSVMNQSDDDQNERDLEHDMENDRENEEQEDE